MYVCLCNAVTDSQIREAVAQGQCSSMRDLNRELGVSIQCGKCGRDAKNLLRQTLATSQMSTKFHHA
jgi:bacterioferritin-associated ferredoxin